MVKQIQRQTAKHCESSIERTSHSTGTIVKGNSDIMANLLVIFFSFKKLLQAREILGIAIILYCFPALWLDCESLFLK